MSEERETTVVEEAAEGIAEAAGAAELGEEAGFGGAASFADAETREILNLLGDAGAGGSCCGGSCCSV